VEDIRIRSLPSLHRLMQNARFPVNQIRVPGERIAAEHDMVLTSLAELRCVSERQLPERTYSAQERKTPHTTPQQQQQDQDALVSQLPPIAI